MGTGWVFPFMSGFSLRRYLILQEQHLLEELSQPPAPAGGHGHDHRAALPHVFQIPFPAPQAEPPRIIQQTVGSSLLENTASAVLV